MLGHSQARIEAETGQAGPALRGTGETPLRLGRRRAGWVSPPGSACAHIGRVAPPIPKSEKTGRLHRPPGAKGQGINTRALPWKGAQGEVWREPRCAVQGHPPRGDQCAND